MTSHRPPRPARPTPPPAPGDRRPARPAGRPDLPPPRPHRARLGGRPAGRRRAGRAPSAASSRPTTPRPARTPGQAQQLLEDRFPAQSGDTVDVVVHADAAVDRPGRPGRRDRRCWPSSAAVPHVVGVDDPYTTPGQRSRPDGRTLVAHARLDVVNPPDMPVADSQRMLDVADAASTDGAAGRARRPDHPAGRAGRHRLRGHRPRRGRDHPAAHVRLGGRRRAADPRRRRRPGGQQHAHRPSLIAFVDAPDWSTSLATMMGIGIGIDYALLMVTRFREWRAAGLDPRGRDRRDPGHRRPRRCWSPAAPS